MTMWAIVPRPPPPRPWPHETHRSRTALVSGRVVRGLGGGLGFRPQCTVGADRGLAPRRRRRRAIPWGIIWTASREHASGSRDAARLRSNARPDAGRSHIEDEEEARSLSGAGPLDVRWIRRPWPTSVALAAASALRGQHHGREADDAEDREQDRQRAARIAGAVDGVRLRCFRNIGLAFDAAVGANGDCGVVGVGDGGLTGRARRPWRCSWSSPRFLRRRPCRSSPRQRRGSSAGNPRRSRPRCRPACRCRRVTETSVRSTSPMLLTT